MVHVKWPLRWPLELADGLVALHSYDQDDAGHLFGALGDQRGWEHIPRQIPRTALELDEMIRSKLGDGYRATFTIRERGTVVGMTSVLYDVRHPAGVEIGGTQLAPRVWGTGVNGRAKRLLLDEIFAQGTEWSCSGPTSAINGPRQPSPSWAPETSGSIRTPACAETAPNA